MSIDKKIIISCAVFYDLECIFKARDFIRANVEEMKTFVTKHFALIDEEGLGSSGSFDVSYNEIICQLCRYDAFVENRVEKYYVVVFAIDYKPCNVWSKDCDPKTLTWIKDNDQKPFNFVPKDYNVNPVLKYFNNTDSSELERNFDKLVIFDDTDPFPLVWSENQ